MTNAARREIRAGFIPLADSAPLIVAATCGFAQAEGLALTLCRETSWATLRDRIAVGHLDAAHVLAPLPIAANLGLSPLAVPMIAPLALGTGANTITVAPRVFDDLARLGASADFAPRPASEAFARLVEERRSAGLPKLVLAIVHAHSAHAYELAYWLAAGGIDPWRDVDIVVLPPPLMPDALASGQIDGFCCGEPWGSVAVTAGVGAILTTSAHILHRWPEKVLGLRRDWAERNHDTVLALIRATHQAALWCDRPENRAELARILALAQHLDQPADMVRHCLDGRLVAASGREIAVDGLMAFATGSVSYPLASHAAWFYAQMVRWGQVTPSEAARATALETFRPDIAAQALAGKVHGGPPDDTGVIENAFFDGSRFDARTLPGA